ncbi:Uncharacterized protein OBRU01_09064 [Operophtera brumata]|uniref:Cytochrome P450 n=1 Tax=Operophtera brumata TaxID=104452 RepID=A0A0L7LAT5_OPEBR|nr:Uncharacterized protein OBRU01_09064 [Operophtera brumata]
MKGVFSKANYVFLFEPDHFEQVFRDEDAKDTYPIRPGFEVLRYYREVLKKSTLNGVYGLTASQGLHWKQFRTKVNPVLLKRNNIKIYARGLDNIAEESVSRIAKLNDQKDFQWEFELEIKKWALESVALIGLGTRLGCLKDDLKIDDPASQLMQCVEDIIELTYQLEIMPSPWRYISTPNYRRIIEVFELQWKGHDIPEADKSIIEKLLAIDEKEKENSPYLRACLKEALRIYHVVPINMRRTTKEHVVGGYHIPKGEFLPERWLVDKNDPLYYGNTHPMVSLPFGFGTRSCIGRRIAELEIDIFVKRLLDTFKITWEGPPANLENVNTRPLSAQANSEEVKPFSAMPGLSSLPIIGPLQHFLPVIGEIGPDAQLFNKLGDLSAKYGPIMQMKGVFARGHFVFLFEPEHFDQVYRAEESSPLRPGFESLTYYREEIKKSTFDGVYGLTTAQGRKWRDFRTKVNPAMLKPKIIKLYAPGLEQIADELVARITKLKDQGDFLDNNFEHEITKWSLESVALVGLGSRLGCLSEDLTNDHPASKLMKCAKDMLDLAFKLEFMPSPWRYISTPAYKKIIKVFDTQWEISEMFINLAKKTINERGHDIPDEDKSIIEKLLSIDEKVAFAVMSLLYRLAVNPEAQEKLRQEIRSKESNRYLKACLKESLRIWHVIPANLRRTSKEHVVGGYQIPKGVDVIAPNQYLSNLDKHYPRAKEFLPERWLVEKHHLLYHGNTHPMVSLPFGFGVRSCIGRRIAELEIEILMKRLLDVYEVSWEGPPVKLVTKLANALEKPLRFRFKPAK